MTERRPVQTGREPTRGGSQWWATLEPAALQDEIDSNRLSERWLLVVGLVTVAVTVLALVLHQVTT